MPSGHYISLAVRSQVKGTMTSQHVIHFMHSHFDRNINQGSIWIFDNATVNVSLPSLTAIDTVFQGRWIRLPPYLHNSHPLNSAFYSGKECTTGINNVLAFSPFGKCFYALINYPGSWHDSSVAQPLADKAIRDLGIYQLCVDQGFGRSGELLDKLVGLFQKKRNKICHV